MNTLLHQTPAIYTPSKPPIFSPKPTTTTKHFISLLQNSQTTPQILSLQAQFIKSSLSHDPFLVFELIRRLCSVNAVDHAVKVFRTAQNPNVFAYTALIDGLVSSGFYHDALLLYPHMINNMLIAPDSYAFTSILKACVGLFGVEECREIHGRVLKRGLGSDRSVRLKLGECYAKCGVFEDALKVFDEMRGRNDPVACTVLISCYADRGLMGCASDVFARVLVKDHVCWTAMIDGYVRNGEMNKALEIFRDMLKNNVRPNEVTIVCVLSACSLLGALELGKWAHSYVKKYSIKVNCVLAAALINMYSKCGSIEEAESVFCEIKERDVSVFNSMIVGLAMHGCSMRSVEVFNEMIKRGINPSIITFVGVLNACSHGGMVDLGFNIFYSMKKKFGIEPQVEHYGCMIDLLGRVGRVKEAFDFITEMKIRPDHIMLGSLLSACKAHKDFELGERVAKKLIDCGDADSGTYVLLSNVYASLGQWNESANVRAKMKEIGILKEPGCSSIEVNNEIHEFILGDLNHPKKEQIYRKLDELNERLRLEGYSPSIEVIVQDIDDCEKEWALSIHSERLAICNGLISTKQGSVIRVVKNLRVCDDCHNVIKLIAKITGRKIVVRDRSRFHHFENGSCSCGDFW